MNIKEFILTNSAVVIDYFYYKADDLLDTDNIADVYIEQDKQHVRLVIRDNYNEIVDAFSITNKQLDELVEDLA